AHKRREAHAEPGSEQGRRTMKLSRIGIAGECEGQLVAFRESTYPEGAAPVDVLGGVRSQASSAVATVTLRSNPSAAACAHREARTSAGTPSSVKNASTCASVIAAHSHLVAVS